MTQGQQQWRSSLRMRLSVVGMILLAAALPVAARVDGLRSAGWMFWLASLVLAGAALAVVARERRRGRAASGANRDADA